MKTMQKGFTLIELMIVVAIRYFGSGRVACLSGLYRTFQSG